MASSGTLSSRGRGGGGVNGGDLGDVAFFMTQCLRKRGINRAPSLTLPLRRIGVGGVNKGEVPVVASGGKEEEECQQPPVKRIRKW